MAEYNEKLVELVKKIEGKCDCDNLRNFLNYLAYINYFKNVTDEEYDKNLADDSLIDFKMTRNKITLGIKEINGKIVIGIDPETCFESVERCSVHAYFPMNRKDNEKFYNLFRNLNDQKSDERKIWLEEAPAYLYGSYAEYGI